MGPKPVTKLLLLLHYQHEEEPRELREFTEIAAIDGYVRVDWADGEVDHLVPSEWDKMHIMFDEGP